MANMAMLVRSCNVLLSLINEYIKQCALYAYNSIKHDTRDSLTDQRSQNRYFRTRDGSEKVRWRDNAHYNKGEVILKTNRKQSSEPTVGYIQRTKKMTFSAQVQYMVYPHCSENPINVFPEKELRGLSPSFHIHVSVSDLYIPRIGPHIFLQKNRQTDGGKYINLSQTNECGMWDWGCNILFLWIFVLHFRFCVLAVHVQGILITSSGICKRLGSKS
jgi:hypothetical protein